MSRVTYAHLPEGGFLAVSSERPDVYLTWLRPEAGTCSLNVSAFYQRNGWEPRTVGRMLDWHAFQVQAETILGVSEHHIDATPAVAHELVYNRDLTQGRCSCGHWRASVPMAGSAYGVLDYAFVQERHDVHAAGENVA